MNPRRHTTLYLIVSIFHTVIGWLGERFGRKRKMIKSADELFKEAQEEKSEAKLTAALDKLNRSKK